MYRGDEWPSLWLATRDRLTGPRAYHHRMLVLRQPEDVVSVDTLS